MEYTPTSTAFSTLSRLSTTPKRSRGLCTTTLNTVLAMTMFALASGRVQAADVKVVVPEGIVLETHLIEAMDSSKIHTGDIFQFVVARDIIIGKYIAISSGSKGVGHVTDAHSAGSHGKSGGIRLAYDYVFANDGTQIPVAHNAEASRADSVPALAIGILTFGVGGLFAHNFVHGHDVIIPVESITNVATLANNAVVLDDTKYELPVAASPVANVGASAAPR